MILKSKNKAKETTGPKSTNQERISVNANQEKHSKSISTLSTITRIIFCVTGIYICFLTWGVLQERISTTTYPVGLDPLRQRSETIFPLNYMIDYYNSFFLCIYNKLSSSASILGRFIDNNDSSDGKFSSFIFLNTSQAIFSWIVSSSVVFYYRCYVINPAKSLLHKNVKVEDLQRGASPIYLALKETPIAPKENERFPSLDGRLFWLYLKISVIYSISSPFAYSSLKFIHYVAMNLGKACKLLPLVLIKIFVKRESIEMGKICNLLLITTGVIGFMFLDVPKEKPFHSLKFHNEIQTQCPLVTFGPLFKNLFGVFLLLINLFLDGLMNTMQDEVFSTYRPSPFHMMFNLNRNSTILMISYLLFAPWSNELGKTLRFILSRPSILPDIFLFSFCGAIGQAIVFLTLGNFGAIFLVTITVTRKLFTILLSVIYFGHSLTVGQWISVIIVFIALILEAYMSASKKMIHPPPVELSPMKFGKYKVNTINNDRTE